MKHHNRNNLNIIIDKTPLTPRMSVNFYFKTNKQEKYAGISTLLERLLFQGTKNYSATEIADMFEKECIDVSIKSKQDYIKISLVFLNEDFNTAMELIKELLINSTFDDIEKEIFKIKGEIISDLDNPKIKLTDTFIKNIFKNHPYSSSHTKILEEIDKITKDDIISAHQDMLNSFKTISVVGDYDSEEEILNYFENNFSFMNNNENNNEIEDIFENNIEKDETIWISKNDASQAQIIQGWLVNSFNNPLCAKYAVLNNILGASGLSSRMFVNLRDKQGLAYTVRSQYETFLHSALFSLYIGTSPKNIQKSLDGFKGELQKLADIPPDEVELQGAKENISGRLKYFSQNNSQLSSLAGYNFIMNLGLDYNDRFLKDINNVTSSDVSEMAKKLISMPKLTVIIAPDKYKI